MKTKYAFLVAVLIFIAGSATYLRSTQSHYNQDNQAFVNRPFIITYSRYRQSDPAKRQTVIELVNSQGRALMRRIGQDGRDIEHAVQQYDRDYWKGWSDREGYERSAHVIRKEQIVGLTAYVYRKDVGGGRVFEFWHAPETGPVPLKEIVELGNGDAAVIEATSIEFREVSDKELEPQVNLLRRLPS